jgi:SAM-dependent methyltransferase
MIKLFFNKKLKEVWGDDAKVTQVNREIIRTKPVLRKLFTLYYNDMISFIAPGGPTLELGSGGGFFGDVYPHAILSDLLTVQGIDIVCDGTSLPFKTESLKNIVMRAVLHHIHDPAAFFAECSRVLSAGGRIIIHESYISPFSYFVYKYLHFEHCALSDRWGFEKGQPLMDCNLATATNIFKRTLPEFKKMFPKLQLIHMDYDTYFAYVLSGGYSYPSAIPNWAFDAYMGFERLLSPLKKLLANMTLIIIEKSD